MASLKEANFRDDKIENQAYLNLRYNGTDTQMMIKCQENLDDVIQDFKIVHDR